MLETALNEGEKETILAADNPTLAASERDRKLELARQNRKTKTTIPN